MAAWTESALEPHVPLESVDFVVLLFFSHLPLPLLLLHVLAQLAHFRQRKTKGDCAHSKKKTAKRKGSAVHAPVQEESPVAAEDSGLFGVRDVCNTCCETPDGATGAFAAEVGFLSVVFSQFALVIASVVYQK